MEVEDSSVSIADNLLHNVDNIYNASYKEKIDEGVDEKRAKRYAKQQAVIKIEEFFRNLLKRSRSEEDNEDEYEEDGMQDYLFNSGKMNTLKKAIKKEKGKPNYDVEVVEILLHTLNDVATNKIYRNVYKKKPVSLGLFGGKKTRKSNRRRRHSKKNKK